MLHSCSKRYLLQSRRGNEKNTKKDYLENKPLLIDNIKPTIIDISEPPLSRTFLPAPTLAFAVPLTFFILFLRSFRCFREVFFFS